MAKNDVTVRILGDASGFQNALTQAEGGLSGFAGKVTSVAGPAIAGGLVAAGAGLVALGSKFDDAYDNIQITTGATGDALKGLQDSFDTVLAAGPSSFDDVSTAIAGLNQGLGLTGQPLEALSTQLLDLSRMTGTDLSTNMENVTQLMNKWGVPATEMGDKMDELFRASQATGIGIDDLGSQMVTMGAPLQQLGFSFEESAALLGGFQQNGINTTQAMTGMRRALGQLRVPGETGRQTLERVTNQIADLEDPAEASALAVELFGSKAGPEMATAIRSGQFSLDDLLGTIEDGTGTIEDSAAATDDWHESWNRLKNQVFVALKPIAMAFFDALTKVMQWIMDHKGVVIAALIAVGIVAVAVFTAWAVAATRAAIANLAATWEFLLIAAAIIAIGAAAIYAYKHWKWFHDAVDATGRWFRDKLGPWLKLAAEVFVAFFRNFPTIVGDLSKALYAKGLELVGGLLKAIVDFWNENVKPWLEKLPGRVVKFVGNLARTLYRQGHDLAAGLWQGFQSAIVATSSYLSHLAANAKIWVGDLTNTLYEKGLNLAQGLWHGFSQVVLNLANYLKDLASNAKTWVGDLAGTLLFKGYDLAKGLWRGFQIAVEFTSSYLKRLGTLAKAWVGDLANTLWRKGWDLINGFYQGMYAMFRDNVSGWLGGMWDRVRNAVGDVAGALYSAGRSIINGLWQGMQDAWRSVLNWLSSLGGIIPDWKGPPAKDRKLLIDNGELIMEGFREGLGNGWLATERMLSGMTASIANGDVPTPATAAARGGGHGNTIIINQPAGIRSFDTAAAIRRYERIQGISAAA